MTSEPRNLLSLFLFFFPQPKGGNNDFRGLLKSENPRVSSLDRTRAGRTTLVAPRAAQPEHHVIIPLLAACWWCGADARRSARTAPARLLAVFLDAGPCCAVASKMRAARVSPPGRGGGRKRGRTWSRMHLRHMPARADRAVLAARCPDAGRAACAVACELRAGE